MAARSDRPIRRSTHPLSEEKGRLIVALVKNGDTITIDAEKREINLEISAAELKARRKAWKAPKPRYMRGVLAKYASHVTSASLGAVTDSGLEL